MNRLKYLRESAGLNQLAVAESLGITPQAVSNYERGINAVPCAYLLQLARLILFRSSLCSVPVP